MNPLEREARLATAADDVMFAEVRQHTLAIAAADRVQADQLLRKGRHVMLARKKLDAATFDRWIAAIGLPPATAALLERAAEIFACEGAELVHPAAMLVLAAPDVPAAAIAAAQAHARRGQVLTYATARELVDHYSAKRTGDGKHATE